MADRNGLPDILDSYIPLGSLTLSLDVRGSGYISRDDWTVSNDIWLAFHEYLVSRDAGPVAFARSLADNKWVRVHARKHKAIEDFATMRVYVLPDDVGRRQVDRSNGYLRKILIKLVNELDTSLKSWEGYHSPNDSSQHYRFESSNDDSLFYLFNTLPSPVPTPSPASCPISNEAIESISGSVKLPGLLTRLYPYQKRTAATMIKREVEPARALDPRLTLMQGPTGQAFYYDRDTGVLLRHQRVYDEARGGILGESMGLGKTLICLAVIVATKGHWPVVPPEYSLDLHPVRPKVGSLMEMAAAAVGHSQIPWRTIFGNLSRAGEDHKSCLTILEDNVGSYVIPAPVARWSRRPSTIPQGKTIRLSTATLIIVPQNLLSQWRSEISEHVEEGCLKLLCLDPADEHPFPLADKLLQYDIILMSRQRFEHEMVPSETAKARSKVKAEASAKGGCSCSLDEDCHCSTSHEYQSPLRDLHFLRIVIDEGHEFSSSGRSGRAYWALQMLHVDRRWVVSGTPANGLLGVEVGTATYETSDGIENALKTITADVLQARRKESALSQERKDLEKLGLLVAGFLQVKPWSNSKDEDPASWHKYIMPYEDGRRKVRSLKTLLESLVVRHRIADIEADIQLPTLHNRVVYLQPSWHDKLSINLFILTLTANAVTSERVDEDYMFHPKNRRQLHILISNLRQSGFYWTSFSPEGVAKTLKVTRAYYEEHENLTTDGQWLDRKLIEKVLTFGDLVLNSASWRCFAEMHEMGMFVEDFPAEARAPWSLVPCQDSDPLLVGATQLAKAQTWVDSHLYSPNPLHGLAGVGTSTMKKLWHDLQPGGGAVTPDDFLPREGPAAKSPPQKKPLSTHTRVPTLTQKQTISRAKAGPSLRKFKQAPDTQRPSDTPNDSGSTVPKLALKSALKASVTNVPVDPFPLDSPLAKARLSGTASAKLSYLLDRISVLHQDEKILVFYEGDHIAWYIAQALDLIDVRYLIYTKTLTLERQNAYITTFNTTETFRVLLMNVHQAAHGLHIASASRVFFVNPVWQPNVEAQAIKRAHRIGQTRPVHVETLVLKDTLEDQMLQRRKGMTAQEHQRAERSLLDDDTMSTIIKNAQFIPLQANEIHDVRKQVARLQIPQQLFGRPGKGVGNVDDPDADLIFPTNSPSSKKSRKRKSDVGQIDRFSGYASFSAMEEANASGASSQRRKSESEHAPDIDDLPPRRRKTANVRFSTNLGADAPESSSRMNESDSIDSPNYDDSSLVTRKVSIDFGSLDGGDADPSRSLTSEPITSFSASGFRRRVGFNLGEGSEEARSLFGGGGSAS
ncbi:hypothetical protein N7G274_000825 [Stereocaulon virgatum]|uniref:Helicase C-terminal domain-containing protein n=1 Tax=Stereocaulon virgatum TaxID=373712 RepID=A0ABR4AM44_9LECA